MALNTGITVDVTDPSLVSEARREAVGLARRLGFSEARCGTVALVVTEAATNIIKHAGAGMIVLQPAPAEGQCGLEVFALDRGRGMANVAASMRDGQSTAGTAGIGLGALSRLASDFDIYSRPGAGTVLRCVVWPDAAPQPGKDIALGVICVPKRGEFACGDGWTVQAAKGRYTLLVVDGLGHGPDAAVAAHAATEAAQRHAQQAPADQIDAIHRALRATRGAAAAVVEIKPYAEVGAFCGVGNIASFVRVEGRTRSLASHNGILGHQVRKVQEFSFPFPERALLYMYTDGMTSRWDPGAYAGLETRHPAVIAGTLYRDHHRGRDDTTLAIVRNSRTHEP
jgi:anti-sigma regulatory factor (Ser/Thr protein kinase)